MWHLWMGGFLCSGFNDSLTSLLHWECPGKASSGIQCISLLFQKGLFVFKELETEIGEKNIH